MSSTNPPRPDDPHFIPADHGTRFNIFPGVEIVTNATDRLMISVVTLEPNSVVPEHSHPHDQMGLLVSGRLEFTIDGVTRLLEPGDAWKIPGGIVHRVVTLEQRSVALDLFHPVREDYL